MPPDALTRAQLEGQRLLQAFASSEATRIWNALPGHDRANVDQWLSSVLPVVEAAKRQQTSLTDAYLGRKRNRPPLGVDLPPIRNGADPEEVYHRPFVTLWTALKDEKPYEGALAAAAARAASTAAMDVQLTMRETADLVQEADDGLYGYERVANPGACEFCSSIDGAYVHSAGAMALHNHCMCALEPLTAPHPRAAKLPSGVAVHQHGELGPTLGSPEHDFTTAAQIN